MPEPFCTIYEKCKFLRMGYILALTQASVLIRSKNIENILPCIYLNHQRIDQVNDFEIVGVTINECLAWSPYTDKIANKISKYVGLLKKLKHYLPASILKILYCSLILPYLNYGSLAWGFDAKRIFKLQKRALRCINNSKFNVHTEPLFKQLNLLKIYDIFLLNCTKFYFKLCHCLLPSYFTSCNFSTHADIHR